MSLLLAASNVKAGTFVWQTQDANGNITAESPAYSGGTINDTSTTTNTHVVGEMYGLNTQASPPTYGGTGGDLCYPDASDNATTYTVSAGGSISTKFTWQPAFVGDLPPTAVIIQQNCNVTMGCSFPPGATLTGSSSTGFGQSGSMTVPTDSLSIAGINYSGASPAGDGSVNAPGCSPSVSQNGNSGTSMSAPTEANFTVAYTATVSPITINPFGANSDGNGGWVIMVGQHFTPELVGIPAALANNVTYSWAVSGTTLQSWTVSSDSKTTTEVDGSGALNIAEPSWYWNDLHNTVENVTCTATVTPPPGQGSPFTVMASQMVSVYVPNWTATGTGGYVKVNNYPAFTNPSQYYLFTGPTLDMAVVGNQEGMSFNTTVQSPVPNLISFGSLQLVQLVTPREATTTFNGYNTQVNFFSQYGEEGLDGTYPYGWIKESNPPGPFTYFTGDSPYIQLLDQITYAATLKHDFKDFLMFLAPGSQQWVPIAHFIWSDDGNAQIPSTRLWKDYASEHGGSDSTGTDTVTPSGNDATFLPSNVFPMWTQID